MNQEIERRRTFAIISHPDAGKTTLTEKFLLFGGQIQVAGAVKNNKIKKTATSDWMDIEKQRGISVSTSVMEFDYSPPLGGRKMELDHPPKGGMKGASIKSTSSTPRVTRTSPRTRFVR